MKRNPKARSSRTPRAPSSPQLAHLTIQKPLTDLTGEEALQHVQLVLKQQRERAYLDYRASRGRCTPTDEAYEADQILEDQLLVLLDAVMQNIQDQIDNP